MKKIVKTVLAGLLSLCSTVCAAQLNVNTSTPYTIPSAESVSGAEYKWLENGVEVPGAISESYTNAAGKDVAGTYVYVRMARIDETCGWQNSNAFVVYVKSNGANQSQGSCAYTEPAVVGTFASFPSTYSGATYVSLTDERDNKNYPVLKMGDRWMMARNLDYRKGLTWRANSGQPSDNTGQDLGLIGSFWCPGANEASTSTEAACDVYGALYSWETAMSFDGKGAWTEAPSTYCAGVASSEACKVNHGRTADGSGREGRGICPPNWHVPTDFEWGVFFDMVEGSGTAHQGASGNNWYGSNAGTKSKSACTGASSETAPLWTNATNKGTDSYGFRVLPTGDRLDSGSYFYTRGTATYFWSSSANSGSLVWTRAFYYDYATVRHRADNRSNGLSVRCIRD